MKFDAIIFDFDGVIVDSEVVVNRALAETLTAYGLPTTLDEAIESFTGNRTEETHRRIEARWQRPIPDDFRARYGEAVVRAEAEMGTVPGAAAFIAGLPPLPRAIASSSSMRWITGNLERLGLSGHFGDHIYSGREHVARTKPAPDIYLHAASAIGVPPVGTVVIEDSPAGVTAARAAGMTVIGLCAGGHYRPGFDVRLSAAGAHHIAASYDEVAALVA